MEKILLEQYQNEFNEIFSNISDTRFEKYMLKLQIKRYNSYKKIWEDGVVTFDFSRIINPNIRNEIYFYYYQKLMKDEWTEQGLGARKYILNHIIDFANKKMSNAESIVQKYSRESLILNFYDLMSDRRLDYVYQSINKNNEIVFYKKHPSGLNLLLNIYDFFKDYYNQSTLFDRDKWTVDDLKLSTEQIASATTMKSISFASIKQTEMKKELKKFVIDAVKIMKWNTVNSKFRDMNEFSLFLARQHPTISSFNEIERYMIEDFFNYLELKKIQSITKKNKKIHLKQAFEKMNLLEIIKTKEKLFYQTDFYYKIPQKPIETIPDSVIDQLNNALNDNRIHVAFSRMVVLLQQTGLRITDLCLLPFNCLKADSEGDYHLTVYQHKTKRFVSIPITKETAIILLEQEEETKSKYPTSNYVFLNTKGNPYNQNSFSDYLNRIAIRHSIKGENGDLYRFRAHAFRRTRATDLLSLGVSADVVSRVLGHTGLHSIKHYTKILDPEIDNALGVIEQYQELLFETAFEYQEPPSEVMKKAAIEEYLPLPNGFCGSKEECATAYACYRCPFFKCHPHFLPQYEKQLHLIKQALKIAKIGRLQRQIDLNEQIMTEIIKVIEKAKNMLSKG
ncbi:tyrosine-type recombinase/integrase [Priestia megaterium]